MPKRLLLCTLLLSSGIFVSAADAQIMGTLDFDVSLESDYFDDCDPGTFCFVVWCGSFDGVFSMDYTGFDGTYDNYDVTMVDWTVYKALCPSSPGIGTANAYSGSGTFQIDRSASPSQRMILDLSPPVGGGLPIIVDSGFVVPAVAFPDFSGFVLESTPTAETFTLTADPVLSDEFFIRGDANIDGGMDISDAVFTLSALFVAGAEAPQCLDASDANDDGTHDISDAIYVLSALFVAGAPQPELPYPDCGADPTADSLDCGAFLACP